MENRRTTRGRPKKVEDLPQNQPPIKKNVTTRQRSSPARRASPSRLKASPVRRSSRPRSTVFGNSASNPTTTNIATSPEKSKSSNESKNDSKKESSNLPTTLTTNTMSRAPYKSSLAPSAVHSSYSSTTQITTETRTSINSSELTDLSKVKDYLRRSVSRTLTSVTDSVLNDGSVTAREGTHTPTTVTENGSRYSRSVSRSVYDDEDSESKAEFSDNEKNAEDEDQYRSFNITQHSNTAINTCRKMEAPKEFGGLFGTTVIVLLGTILAIYLQWCCGKQQCAFKKPNFSAILDLKYLTQKVFQNEAVGAFLMFNFGIFMLSAALFGKRVILPSERGNDEYKFNVALIAILLTIAASYAEYLKYSVAEFVLKHYLRFCIYNVVFAVVLALWGYIRANVIKENSTQPTKMNIYGRSGNFLTDFALGRQINPKWLGIVEFKLVAYRTSLLTTLLFAECFIYKNVQIPWLPDGTEGILNIASFYANSIKYDTVSLLAASLLLVYILDAIIFEHHLASSFELQFEGYGYLLLLRYAATPFLLSAVSKYTFDRRIPLTSKYVVHVAIILLFVGLAIKRLSNAMKYKYRTNPGNKLFHNIETIHTFQGRRLLLGPFWGCLRQPNYSGDILALVALTVPLYVQFSWPPFISILLLIATLIHRTTRVHARNMSRYHSSWVRYCMRVPNFIIPKVF